MLSSRSPLSFGFVLRAWWAPPTLCSGGSHPLRRPTATFPAAKGKSFQGDDRLFDHHPLSPQLFKHFVDVHRLKRTALLLDNTKRASVGSRLKFDRLKFDGWSFVVAGAPPSSQRANVDLES